MFYYFINAFFGLVTGILLVILLFCSDCSDGNFAAHWSGFGVHEKNAFVVIGNQTDMLCRQYHVDQHRAEVNAKCIQGYALILVNYRLKVITEILTGAMLVALLASIIRRGGELHLSRQVKVMVTSTAVGFALTAARVQYDYEFNFVNGDEVWTEAIWSAVNLSNTCILLALLAIPMTTALRSTRKTF